MGAISHLALLATDASYNPQRLSTFGATFAIAMLSLDQLNQYHLAG